MPAYDFDFQRYVKRRKGEREAQVREGAAYAFPGDVRLLRTLDRVRPVQLALEEAGRLWRHAARVELLGAAIRASSDHYPDVYQAAGRCAQLLHIDPPVVYVAPQPASLGVLTLGTAEDVYIVLPAPILHGLKGAELLDLLGRECGHIQNGHVPFLTALYYLTHQAGGFIRWIVKPATLTLAAWSRRADLSADRAGLLCTRSLDVSLAALAKAASATFGDDARAATAAKRRADALRRFAGSAYFRTILGEPGGEAQESCDAAVARILDGDEPAPRPEDPA